MHVENEKRIDSRKKIVQRGRPESSLYDITYTPSYTNDCRLWIFIYPSSVGGGK